MALSAPPETCKAWVTFVGTFTGFGIVASRNVASITDNGVGNFEVAFTAAMPDDAYAIAGVGSANSGPQVLGSYHANKLPGSFRALFYSLANAAVDPNHCMVSVFR